MGVATREKHRERVVKPALAELVTSPKGYPAIDALLNAMTQVFTIATEKQICGYQVEAMLKQAYDNGLRDGIVIGRSSNGGNNPSLPGGDNC